VLPWCYFTLCTHPVQGSSPLASKNSFADVCISFQDFLNEIMAAAAPAAEAPAAAESERDALRHFLLATSKYLM
jgi:hypothetical protein